MNNSSTQQLPAVPEVLDEAKKDSRHHNLGNIEQISGSIWFISLSLWSMSTAKTVEKKIYNETAENFNFDISEINLVD